MREYKINIGGKLIIDNCPSRTEEVGKSLESYLVPAHEKHLANIKQVPAQKDRKALHYSEYTDNQIATEYCKMKNTVNVFVVTSIWEPKLLCRIKVIKGYVYNLVVWSKYPINWSYQSLIMFPFASPLRNY